jgi:hypothetical protein
MRKPPISALYHHHHQPWPDHTNHTGHQFHHQNQALPSQEQPRPRSPISHIPFPYPQSQDCTNHPHAVCLWLLLYTAHAHQFACLSTFKGPVFLFHGHTGMARLMNGLLHQLNGRYDSLRGYFVRFVHQFDGSMKG